MDKKLILMRIDELMIEKGIKKYQLKENADISSTIYQYRIFFAFDQESQRNVKNKEIIDSICQLNDEQIKLLELLIRQYVIFLT